MAGVRPQIQARPAICVGLLLACIAWGDEKEAELNRAGEADAGSSIQHTWHWSDEEWDIFWSLTQYASGNRVEMVHEPGEIPDGLAITVFATDGRVRCSWRGDRHSVFVQSGGTLVYALNPSTSCGCTLVAVDLASGKERWRTELRAVGSHPHSAYHNRVIMSVRNDTIFVYGDESKGRYAEQVDLRSGKTVRHQVFPPLSAGK